jgi:hypothetical protein
MKGATAIMDSRHAPRLPVLAAGALALLFIAAGAGCKFGSPDYTITVVIPPEITGTPTSGTYTYKELTQVGFSYSAVNPVYSVEVFLNNKIRYSNSGSVVLYGDGYQLTADIIDNRGNWQITMVDTTTATTAFEFTLTLTGPDVLSGTFTDSRGFHGTWAGSSGILILTYTDWYDYVLTNTVYGLGSATSGTYEGNSTTGTWTAKKAT